MNDVVMKPSELFDFRNLSEVELEVIVQVIQKDFEVKASEKARLRRRRRKLKEADERVTILANSDFNESFCVICFKRFVLLFYPKRSCISCRHCMCRDCSVWVPRDKQYICLLCQNERTLKSMSCDWYYGLLKSRFQHDASELVAQSLYSNQGQYSIVQIFFRKICVKFKPEWMSRLKPHESTSSSQDTMITPDLLQKVKGAQISRYRQKIQGKWEEMQERLRRLELSELNRVKREDAYRSINDEYKMQFKNILKEFSQVLYITLENYAAKIEDMHLNINEQVMDTVHEEVELLIGYKINLAPEDMQSVVSDVESTVSMFMGNQLEERLAVALVNRINEDHHKVDDFNNYDIDCLENIRADDQSSSTTFLYRGQVANGRVSSKAFSSGRSSITTSTRMEPTRNVTTGYVQVMIDSSQCGSESDFITEDEIHSEVRSDLRSEKRSEAKSEVALSASEVQHIITYPNSGRVNITERMVNVPVGEPINLLVELNGVTRLEVTWSVSAMGRKVMLRNDQTTEIVTSNDMYGSSSNLRIWESKLRHAGVYTAHANNRPLAVFVVTMLDDDVPPEKPSFRLKLINSSVRSGQCAEFSVEATGRPEPRLTFYHNTTILNIPSDKYSLEHIPNISRVILKINRVAAADKGTYRCVASNDSGYCECSAELQVTSINFRFEKKMPMYEPSSGSSVDENTPTPQPFDQPDFDLSNNVFDSNASVNQACQGDKPNPRSDTGMVMTSDTVIGRELPDDITNQNLESLARQRSSLSRSDSNKSEVSPDVSPTTARANALRSSSIHRSDSASHVARIRDMFNHQSLSPPLMRAESITRRTPPIGKRKLESQLTREVRIRRDNSLEDNN